MVRVSEWRFEPCTAEPLEEGCRTGATAPSAAAAGMRYAAACREDAPKRARLYRSRPPQSMNAPFRPPGFAAAQHLIGQYAEPRAGVRSTKELRQTQFGPMGQVRPLTGLSGFGKAVRCRRGRAAVSGVQEVVSPAYSAQKATGSAATADAGKAGGVLSRSRKTGLRTGLSCPRGAGLSALGSRPTWTH